MVMGEMASASSPKDPAPQHAERCDVVNGDASDTAFTIGPMSFLAHAWPTAWAHYWRPGAQALEGADHTIVRPADALAKGPGSGAASIVVVHGGMGISAPAKPGRFSGGIALAEPNASHPGAGEPARPADPLRAWASDDDRWMIEQRPVFSATFDTAQRRLTICADDDTAPHLSLGNALRVLTSALLPIEHDGLMLHASSGILADQGIVFAGISTAGKSTMAAGFVDTCYLTDDVTLLANVTKAPMLVATPFHGALGRRGVARAAPLRALCILGDKVTHTRIERLTPHAAVVHIIRHVARFFPERTLTGHLLDLVTQLVHTVPVRLVHRSLADPSDDIVRAVLRDVRGSAG